MNSKNNGNGIPSREFLNSALRNLTDASNHLACLHGEIARASEAVIDAGSDLEHLSKDISTIHETVSEAGSFLARELAFGERSNG